MTFHSGKCRLTNSLVVMYNTVSKDATVLRPMVPARTRCQTVGEKKNCGCPVLHTNGTPFPCDMYHVYIKKDLKPVVQ
jgi:hypothetical protein